MTRVALLLLVSSCTPTLVDGAYTCEDGVCPPGWTCFEDRCRLLEGDPLLEVCDAASDCATEACTIDVPGSSAGYCTYACESDADCNDLPTDHGAPRCVASRCLMACTTGTDCPSGSSCQFPHEPETPPPDHGVCSAVDDAAFDGSTGCAEFRDCMPPAFCLASDNPAVGTVGVCSMWCERAEHCPGGTCVDLLVGAESMPIRHCLRECFPTQGPDACRGGLVCGRLGAGGPPGQHCIPEDWVGQDLPLPGAPRR